MSEKKRTLMSSKQKAKVALEAAKGSKTVNEIAQEYPYCSSHSKPSTR